MRYAGIHLTQQLFQDTDYQGLFFEKNNKKNIFRYAHLKFVYHIFGSIFSRLARELRIIIH